MIAAIQAGGRSSRMGEDKAWLQINGRPLIEHVLAAAQPVAERGAIVINQTTPNLARYQQLAARWGAELLYDRHDHCGPLGGIGTVLQQCEADESALILACDMPFVTTEFLQLLRSIHTAEQNELTVPLDQTEHPQMLAAIYAARCLSPVAAMLAADDFKVRGLEPRVKTRRVYWAEYAHLPGAERLLANLNTPADVAALPPLSNDGA